MGPLQCANCHGWIPEDVHPYTMRIELFPRIEESLEISEEDLEKDFSEEIKEVVEQIEAMSESEIELEEERIYCSYRFVLCHRCRDDLARKLRRNMSAS